jgi:hypothetical protein
MELDMRVFLYSSEPVGKGKEIQGVMGRIFRTDQLDVLRSIDNLSQMLQKPWEEKPIVVILVCNKDELLDFVSIREQLYLVRLILVLPDAEEGTVSLAHRLRPNYLTYVHRDSKELKAVLQKMSGRN